MIPARRKPRGRSPLRHSTRHWAMPKEPHGLSATICTRRRAASLRMARGPSSDVVALYQRGCRLLQRIGSRRHAWQTATEYAAACRGASALEAAWLPFEELTRLFLKARYGRAGAAPADAQGASAALSALRSSLRR